jgi:hypothetical protein
VITASDVGKRAKVVSGPHGLDKFSKDAGYFRDGMEVYVISEVDVGPAPDYDKTFCIRRADGAEWFIAADNLEALDG